MGQSGLGGYDHALECLARIKVARIGILNFAGWWMRFESFPGSRVWDGGVVQCALA